MEILVESHENKTKYFIQGTQDLINDVKNQSLQNLKVFNNTW